MRERADVSEQEVRKVVATGACKGGRVVGRMAVRIVGTCEVGEGIGRHVVRADLSVGDGTQVCLIGVVALDIEPGLERMGVVQVGEIVSA